MNAGSFENKSAAYKGGYLFAFLAVIAVIAVVQAGVAWLVMLIVGAQTTWHPGFVQTFLLIMAAQVAFPGLAGVRNAALRR